MAEFIRKVLMLCIKLHVTILHVRSNAINQACYGDQEISFYCALKDYVGAKKSCEDNDSYLVKIDSDQKAQAVNSLIDKTECSPKSDILVGATSPAKSTSPRVWTWLDGSTVQETGYENWKVGQPNNLGIQEGCLILDATTKQWKDSPCWDTEQYVCQKNVTLMSNVDLHTIMARRCMATADACNPHTEWRKNTEIVSYNVSSSVYQDSSSGLSLLHFENATIADTGRYSCVAWLIGYESEPISTPEDIFVNGTPTIVDIRSFTCNTSLQILWKPNVHSIGFLHRIITTEFLTEEPVDVTEATPLKVDVYFTEVSGLNQSTNYNIKIVACSEANNCTNNYETSKSASTRGMIRKISDVTMQETNTTGNDTCVVTWEKFQNISSYQLTIHSSALELSIIDSQTHNNITSTNYTFKPSPDIEYKVEILPVTDENYCPKPAKAVGTCVGKKYEVVNEEDKLKQTDALLFIIPSAAVGAVIFLAICTFIIRKRMKSTQESTEGMTTNPIYGETDYGNLHSSSNHQNIPVQDEAAGSECSTTRKTGSKDDEECFPDADVYAIVNKPNKKGVEEEGTSGGVTSANKSTIDGEKATQNADNMVDNPIYDMEPSTSQPTTSQRNAGQNIEGVPVDTDQQSSTDDPIYSAVKKVKIKKNKKGD